MIESPYITKEELAKKDLHAVDILVSIIAPTLNKIATIVMRNGVNDFSIFVTNKNKKIRFVMSVEDVV